MNNGDDAANRPPTQLKANCVASQVVAPASSSKMKTNMATERASLIVCMAVCGNR